VQSENVTPPWVLGIISEFILNYPRDGKNTDESIYLEAAGTINGYSNWQKPFY